MAEKKMPWWMRMLSALRFEKGKTRDGKKYKRISFKIGGKF